MLCCVVLCCVVLCCVVLCCVVLCCVVLCCVVLCCVCPEVTRCVVMCSGERVRRQRLHPGGGHHGGLRTHQGLAG